jgi:hypothetical protein
MSDETRPDEPRHEPRDPAAADARDARLAALLAVEPLDEITRRRLVQRAVSTVHPTARGRVAAVASIAAAIVVGVVVGALLVHRPYVPGPTTALGNPTATGAAPKAAADAPAIAVAPGPVNALGNLGDVTTDDKLRSAVADAEQRGSNANEDARQAPCASTNPTSIGLVAIVAAGVGDSDGRPVAVLIGTSPAGKALAVVVQQPDCTLIRSVKLPD